MSPKDATKRLKWTAPTVIKGTRFSMAEWQAIYAAMNHLGMNWTDLSKASLADYLERHNVPWPRDATKEAS